MWSKLVSTEIDDEQKLDMAMPMGGLSEVPDFPAGMKICMDETLLKRLELSSDCEPGDYLDLRCFATVTSVNKMQVNGKDRVRVELTIEKVAVEAEMESDGAPGDDDE